MKNQPKWLHESRELSTLTPYKHNPRVIKGKKFEDLKASISKFGMVQPLVINTDGTIIGGHARFYYLQEIEAKVADVYVPDRKLTEKEVQELNVRLNKNVAGDFDFEILANYFEIEDLTEWGFEAEDFGMKEEDTGAGDGDDDLGIPEGEKGDFKQMTFILHTNQHDVIKDLLEAIKQGELIKDTTNENVNGNALYTLCKRYKDQNGM